MKILLRITIVLTFILLSSYTFIYAQSFEEVVNDRGELEVWHYSNICQCWSHLSTTHGPGGDGRDDDDDDHNPGGNNGSGNTNDDDDDDDDWDDYDWWSQWWEDPWDNWVWISNSNPNNNNNPVICPQIESRTFYPPNKTRTTLGIGEEVEIRIKDKCGATVLWEVRGEGKVIGNIHDQEKFFFQATWRPGRVSVYAKLTNLCSECPDDVLRIDFEVIAPSGIYFDDSAQHPYCPGIHHYQFRPSGGYFADSYLLPDIVNFYNVAIKEGQVAGVATGSYFQNFSISIPDHEANTYVPSLETVFRGKGTKIGLPDNIYVEFVCRSIRDPNLQGTIGWDIENFYWNETDQVDVPFTHTLQQGENIGGSSDPKFIISKVNSSNFTHLLDPDRCTTGINPCN